MVKINLVVKAVLLLALLGKAASVEAPLVSAYNLSEANKTEAETVLAAGNAWESQGQFKEAIESYLRVANLSPAPKIKLASQVGLVTCYLALHDEQKGLSLLSSLINRRPPLDALLLCNLYLKRGLWYKASGQWLLAIDDFQHAAACPATKERALFGMAESYHALKKYRLALTRIAEVTWMNPKNASAFKLGGNWWYELGKYQEAKANYSTVLKLGFHQYDVYARRGDCHRQLGDKEAALDDCAQAIRLKPDDPIGYKIRARVYYDRGDDENAIADLNKAIALSPRDRKLYMQRAVVYDEMKEPALATQDRQFAKSLLH